MKVQETYVIDGNIVSKVAENSVVTFYETKDMETIYVVCKGSEEVLTRIDLTCDMSQGTGFISDTTYTDLSED